MTVSRNGKGRSSGRAATRGRRRQLGGAAAAAVLASTLAACGGDSGAANALTWYINPDSGGQAEIAARCSQESGGAYTIEVAQLPREASAQREQLIRRLAANDASIDLMSLDPPFIPEFAEAGFLAPVPEDVAQRVSEDVVQSAVAGATWDGELVTVPFWANTQLLWYRESVAEEAGLDMSQPVTWDQILEAAQQTDTLIGAQGARAESLTVWLNALIESAGGSIITENAEDPGDIQLGLESEQAARAAEVMRAVADSGVAGAAFSTENEDASATEFEGPNGGFMVNWPFVYGRALSAAEAGTLDPSVPEDYGWAVYPRVNPNDEAAPPYGGINLGVGAFSAAPELAYQAAECIVSDQNQAYYFTTNGNPASSIPVYDDPEVLEVFPMAPEIRESLEIAAPRPQTVYYNEVSAAIQRTYHPPGSVVPGVTGPTAAELIRAVLAGEQLL
ncbi:extracellular solute-binding protein [Geodermatophilus obscurus]|uniref:Extracellular solute-binding protein family 1 n=1 Tax=Geodermatophilus obscurus (strain ATCC 25078 / DSM 43160 / JCM 3152 / CCUG 61914 / KCC A-0152 / KCTC 9177 / NBRC 13315 / NRRL B-3577 / G-20) TaxID=526225 RepID=D2SDT6_GEOOG|nr:extracellular solute-binding protein [Geodermatophilus obscurus]ADB76502.1 extracellular solute-binding protein family 1 [Geodermatophilus obscurus DSM 43160]